MSALLPKAEVIHGWSAFRAPSDRSRLAARRSGITSRRRSHAAPWSTKRPAVVPPLPAGDYRERADAAVLAWIDDIFSYYGIDPASPDRWEQAFWFLAPRAFPNFR